VLSLAALVLHWKLFFVAIDANTPSEHVSMYDSFMKSIGRHDHTKSNRLLSGIDNTAQRLKKISRHPVIGVTTSDVLFTTISLLIWTFTRDLDIAAILDNSIFSFLTPTRPEKHVAFDGEMVEVTDESPEPESAVPALTPRKRGRPKKGALTNGASSSAAHSTTGSAGSMRRSTRNKGRSDYESEAEETYEPPNSAKKALAEIESDGATTSEDLVHGGEATALAMFMAFVGGLGQLAASVLGAEVTTVNE
jgi:hypothetical protein